MRYLFLLFITIYAFANVKVATAGNVAFAINDLADIFYKQTHIKVIPIIGSSGKLASQIENHAPYDIYLSANMKYPQYLYNKHLAITKPKVYAKGKLVLFSKYKEFDLLKAKKIAIANPKTAPYGTLSIKYLKEKHLYSKVKNKLIIAPNIAAAFNYAVRIVDCGFVAKSLLFKIPKYNNPAYYKNLDFNETTFQGVVLLTNNPQAKKFFNFLFSSQAKKIFKKYGYE